MKYKVHMRYEDMRGQMDVYIIQEEPNGRRSLCVNMNTMNFKEILVNAPLPKPTFTLPDLMAKPFIQAIVDSAKDAGITPVGDPVSANELVATKYHLEDMREIVFHRTVTQPLDPNRCHK